MGFLVNSRLQSMQYSLSGIDISLQIGDYGLAVSTVRPTDKDLYFPSIFRSVYWHIPEVYIVVRLKKQFYLFTFSPFELSH